MQYRSFACWDSDIESISSDHSAAYFRRKSKIDHPAGRFLLFSPPAVHGLFARARTDCGNERCRSPAMQWHCNNVVYTPKSNFVILPIGRGREAIHNAYTGKLLSAGSTTDVWHRYDCYLMRCTEFRVNCSRGLRVINIINARYSGGPLV